MNEKLFELPLLDLQVRAGLRGDFETGWKISQEIARVSPNCHRGAFNRAWYEMARGNLLEGLKLLDRGRWENVFGDQPLPTDKPIYFEPEHASLSEAKATLQNKNILLCSEGGLGDEIINVRFAQDFALRGAKVTVTCDPSLKSIFARVPGVASVVSHKSAPEVYHDFWVPAMSAARILNYNYEKLSGETYLFARPDYTEKWKEILSAKFAKGSLKIGLRFFGNPKFEHEQFRKFPAELLKNAVGDHEWINLQKEETDLPIENWEDTLAIIHNLDLVITSCTSVAHASAALGKPTWVIVPVLPYYVWAMPGESSPWYQSVRLFRQKSFGNWSDVFDEVKRALNDYT